MGIPLSHLLFPHLRLEKDMVPGVKFRHMKEVNAYADLIASHFF